MFDLPSMVPVAPAGAAGGGEKVSHLPVQLLGWDGAGTGRVWERKGKLRTCSLPEHTLRFLPCPNYTRELQQR